MKSKKILIFSFFLLSLISGGDVRAASLDSMVDEEIQMIRGDLEAVKTYELTRVSITNPEIADIVKVDNDQILMIAKQPGKTLLFIWDNYGKRSLIIRVIEEDLKSVQLRIEELLEKSGITTLNLDINNLEGKVMVSGSASSDEQMQTINSILEPFSKSVANLVKAEGSNDLVQIDAQITELSSSYTKNMGLEWTSALTYTETLPGKIEKAADIFRVGEFSRTTQILGTINALITEGKGRVLSRPKLVCLSGKEASFLVGGQIPVTKTNTSSGGNVQEDIEYKDYGVNLTVMPTIREGGKIDIDISIDVSDIDATNAVGDNVAFTTRSAQTQLYLENGQTVVLAGLIKTNNAETIKRIPIFSDVPVVGALFRNRNSTPNTETELVITLTPTILEENKYRAAGKSTAKTSYVDELDLEENASDVASGTFAASPTPVVDKNISAKTFVPGNMAPYIRQIQERIAKTIVYPEKARRYGWEGTVKLALHIMNDGTLASALVSKSSGYDVFDKDAVNVAKKLAPFSAFPPELNLQDLTVTIPIVYKLDNR